MAKILVAQHIGGAGVQKLREAGHEVTYRDETEPMSPAELQTAVRHAEGLVTLLTDRVDTAVLNAAPNLKMIANVAVGYDNIDVPAATERGILVSNTPDVLTETTADHAFALLLSLARRVPEADAFMRAGKYEKFEMFPPLLGLDVFGNVGHRGVGTHWRGGSSSRGIGLWHEGFVHRQQCENGRCTSPRCAKSEPARAAASE